MAWPVRPRRGAAARQEHARDPTRAALWIADAAYIDSAHLGLGGGDLYSFGCGLRFGIGGSLNGEVEIAAPIGADRISTGDRDPRISFRLGANL